MNISHWQLSPSPCFQQYNDNNMILVSLQGFVRHATRNLTRKRLAIYIVRGIRTPKNQSPITAARAGNDDIRLKGQISTVKLRCNLQSLKENAQQF